MKSPAKKDEYDAKIFKSSTPHKQASNPYSTPRPFPSTPSRPTPASFSANFFRNTYNSPRTPNPSANPNTNTNPNTGPRFKPTPFPQTPNHNSTPYSTYNSHTESQQSPMNSSRQYFHSSPPKPTTSTPNATPSKEQFKEPYHPRRPYQSPFSTARAPTTPYPNLYCFYNIP